MMAEVTGSVPLSFSVKASRQRTRAPPLALVKGETVTIIYPYEGKLYDELAMKPGDVIIVDDWDVSEDWARGTLNSKTGLFYKAFVKPSSKVPFPDDFKLKEVRGKPEGYEAAYRGKGYILKEKLDDVECIVCHNLADNVHQTSCCGNTICLQCTDAWKQKNNSCPNCRKQPLKVIEDPRTKLKITGATVYCPNYHFGCNWVDSFGRVAQHLAYICNYEIKKCSNLKCEVLVPEKYLAAHQAQVCLQRIGPCPCFIGIPMIPQPRSSAQQNCTKSCSCRSLTHHDIITDHYRECRSWPMRCPNSCDPYLTLKRSALDRHVEVACPEVVFDCKFAEMGVQEEGEEEGLAKARAGGSVRPHDSHMFEELIKLKSDHLKMKHENAQLKKELDQLKSQKKYY